MKIAGISGSLRSPSRTSSLVVSLLDAVAERVAADVDFIDLAVAGPALFGALSRDGLSGSAADVVATVEAADALVVATPVYRGSYTGAFKHLFDLVDRDALAGKPVLIAATAGLPGHALVIEHQLRPLFGFFRALTVPTSVFVTEADFQDFRIADASVAARIARAAEELVDLLDLRASTHGHRARPKRPSLVPGQRAAL